VNNPDMSVEPELVESLRKLGLNQYEAKAYSALCTFGSLTVGEISAPDKGDLPRPRAYDVLTSLQEKGFVSVMQGRPLRYAALPLDEAVKTLRKQKEAGLQDEIKQMDALAKTLSSKLKPAANVAVSAEDRVWTLKGRDAIYSRMSSMISGAKKHVVLASHAEHFKHKFKAHNKELAKAKERGVRLSFVTAAGQGDGVEMADQHVANDPSTRMLLTDNEALLFLTDPKSKPDDEQGLWLKSPHVVNTLKASLGIRM